MERLRKMTGDAVLDTICAMSTVVASKPSPNTITATVMATKSHTKNLKNVSNAISDAVFNPNCTLQETPHIKTSSLKNVSNRFEDLLKSESKEEVECVQRRTSVQMKEQLSGKAVTQLLAHECTKRSCGILRIVESSLIEKYGSDSSKLSSQFEKLDTTGSGKLNQNSFRSVLESGVILSPGDYEDLCSNIHLDEAGLIDYRRFIKRITSLSDDMLPDMVKNPVSSAQRNTLSIHRKFGAKILDKWGCLEDAYSAFACDELNPSRLINLLETEHGFRLGQGDRELLAMEFQKQGGNQHISKSVFKRVLLGGDHLDGKRRQRVKKETPDEIVSRVRGHIETRKSWGTGMKDFFLSVDVNKQGCVTANEVCDALAKHGCIMTDHEKVLFGNAISDHSGKCSYSRFAQAIAGPLNGEESVQVHCFNQRRHRGNSPRSREVEISFEDQNDMDKVLDQLASRNASLQTSYLSLKSGHPLTPDVLKRKLEQVGGVPLTNTHFETKLKNAGIKNHKDEISFVQFNQLFEDIMDPAVAEQIKKRPDTYNTSAVAASTCWNNEICFRDAGGNASEVISPRVSKRIHYGKLKVLHLKIAPPNPKHVLEHNLKTMSPVRKEKVIKVPSRLVQRKQHVQSRNSSNSIFSDLQYP